MCDKPTCLNAAEAERLVLALEEAQQGRTPGQRLVAIMDHELRFTEAWQEARRQIEAGALGQIHYADVRILMPAAKNTTAFNWWSQEERGGGVLGAIGSHMVDSLRWLLGATVEEVSAHLRATVPELPDELDDNRMRAVTSDDYCSMQLRLRLPGLERPLDAHMTLGYAGSEALGKHSWRKMTFVGSLGVMELDLLDTSMHLYDNQGRVVVHAGGEGISGCCCWCWERGGSRLMCSLLASRRGERVQHGGHGGAGGGSGGEVRMRKAGWGPVLRRHPDGRPDQPVHPGQCPGEPSVGGRLVPCPRRLRVPGPPAAAPGVPASQGPGCRAAIPSGRAGRGQDHPGTFEGAQQGPQGAHDARGRKEPDPAGGLGSAPSTGRRPPLGRARGKGRSGAGSHHPGHRGGVAAACISTRDRPRFGFRHR